MTARDSSRLGAKLRPVSDGRPARPGAFVLSLDFELHWGVRDHTSAAAFRERGLRTRAAIPTMLSLFRAYDVHATWATVGLLFADGRDEALRYAPEDRPRYRNADLDPYAELEAAGDSEAEDPLHFAPSLIARIHATPHQELATHTFSHFYCLEEGQDEAAFAADLEAAQAIGASYGDVCRSLVLPRNQANPCYEGALARAEIAAVRTQGDHWAYRARAGESAARRALRLADAYLPVSGHRHAPWPRARAGQPVAMEASHFLRPYARRLAAADDLRLTRIGRDLEDAARRGRVLHLWWHPHNFGADLEENLAFLEALFWRVERLRRDEGLLSLTMGEMAQTVSESA